MLVKFWIYFFIFGGITFAFSPGYFETNEFLEELVIPKRIQENGESSIYLNPQNEGELKYKIEGKLVTYVLEVFKSNMVFNGGFIVRTVERNENKTEYHNRKDCHYYGKIIGRQSWISVDVCNGISGIIVDGNQTINIKPIEFIHEEGFIHQLIYERFDKTMIRFHDDTDRKGPRNNSKSQNHSDDHRIKRNTGNAEKIVEMYLVLDSALFNGYLRGGTNLAIKYTEPVMQHLDTLYRSVGIRTVLIGLEMWNNTDPVTSSKDATELLNDFLDYSANKIVPYMKPPDLVALITHRTFTGMVVGMAFVDVMCGHLSGTVVQHDNDPWKIAITLAHEVGHTLGLIHDDPTCSCSNGPGNCIMEAVVSNGGGTCLYDKPDVVYGGPICGNGIKEKGELCDCGDAKSCAKSACCLPGCKLKTGMECSSGACCKNCKLKRKCTLCRPIQNECDLEEYCDGISEECPPNTFKRDFIVCGTKTAEGYCYRGRCRSNTGQCEYIWGTGSTPSHTACFRDNNQGTVSGNCGSKAANSYIKCNNSDVMCGTIFCDSTNRYPVIPGQQAIRISKYTIPVNGKLITCRAAQIELGDDVPDPGLVDNGSPCLQGRSKLKGVCLERKCVKLANVKLKSCPMGTSGTECSGNGICNNKGECFCNLNFTGNDCSKKTFPCEESPKEKPNSLDSAILEPWKIAIISVSGVVFIVIVNLGIIFLIKKINRNSNISNAIEDEVRGEKQKPTSILDQEKKPGSTGVTGKKKSTKKAWTKTTAHK